MSAKHIELCRGRVSEPWLPAYQTFSKPRVRRCLTGCNSPCGIKVSYGTDKASEVVANVLPKNKGYTRVLLIKAIPCYLEDRDPQIIANVLGSPPKSIFVCKM